MGQSMSASTTATVSDDNKIRIQIQNDLNAFTDGVSFLFSRFPRHFVFISVREIGH